MEHRTCSGCDEIKAIEQFATKYHCRGCRARIDKEYREKNKQASTRRSLNWTNNNKIRVKQHRTKAQANVRCLTEKLCTYCSTTKSIDEFKTKNGFVKIYCSPCWSEANRISRNKHKEKRASQGKDWYKRTKEARKPIVRAKQIATERNNPKKTMLQRSKGNAKTRAREFTITVNDFEIPTHCPLLNIPIYFRSGVRVGKGHQQFDSASIDRIDNNKGYVPGNVWVISDMANKMKSDASLDQLKTFATNILKVLTNQ